MRPSNLVVAFAFALTALGPRHSTAAELPAETQNAWDDYVRSADAHMEERLRPGKAFLWADEAPHRLRLLRAGEVLVLPVIEDGARPIPNGLIHDWLGAAFIPNATLASVLSVVRDYNRYKDFYKPPVVDSKLLNRTSAEQRFSMVSVHKVLFVATAFDSHYEARDFQVDPKRSYEITGSTRVQQIVAYGSARERRLPPDGGSAYIWRLHSIARYQERDGGVYIELEAIALSRSVPSSFQWLLTPVIKRLSRNSLATSLRQTRDAVAGSPLDRGNVAPATTQPLRPGRANFRWNASESAGSTLRYQPVERCSAKRTQPQVLGIQTTLNGNFEWCLLCNLRVSAGCCWPVKRAPST